MAEDVIESMEGSKKHATPSVGGLDKELQISEVGINLFQFKFQSEYELEWLLQGGPWTFDNQLLMLTWCMSANNVVLEHASLCVQIWGEPFDMMSPNVATKVGNRIGAVEDVERRRRIDDHNFFLRVRVALPISKPLRRGHDLYHCPTHFVVLKKATSIDYQYGDWLKADSGRSKPPPRWSRDSPPRAMTMGRTDDLAKENSEVQEVAMAVARASNSRDNQLSQNGRHGFGGIAPEIQGKIFEDNAAQNSNTDKNLPKLPPSGDLLPNLNDDSNNAPNATNTVLGHKQSKPNKPKNTWTRIRKMDVRPLELSNTTTKSTMGKRGVGDVLAEEYNRGPKTTFHKLSKVDFEDGKSVYILAGVEDHPCRE
nr:hypothetical protein CFP56_37638 [Quercus suber]